MTGFPSPAPPAARAAAPDFAAALARRRLPALRRAAPTTLQVNVGLACDLACHHCHVEAGPKRREALGPALAARVIHTLERHPRLAVLDLTGGAPELNPHFRELVAAARALGRRVIDRCNLTILTRPGQQDTAAFLAAQGVHVIASLPCYEAANVDAQRGRAVHAASIEGLRQLNALGYGDPARGLRLDLVHNPLGAALPPSQAALEERYREELAARHGLRFDRLLTLTNMPIARFARELARRGESERYLALLAAHFNPATVDALMCRTTLSVDWEGRLHDCDFNLALGLRGALPASLFELEDADALAGLPIATGSHCFGCTAGAGSSCGGALAAGAVAGGA